MTHANQGPPRIHFITNGVFSTSIAGGDIHFLKLAEAAAAAGYVLNFFGGTALQEVVRAHGIQGTVTLTDQTRMAKVDQGRLTGQWALFRDCLSRYRQTLRLRSRVAPGDLVYAVSDYWFDVLPAVRCPARRKLMVLHMEAPRFDQILKRSRPDVDPARLASLHYWASQEWSLRRFCRCPRKHVLYLHPAMQGRLRRLGLSDQEMTCLSYGLDVRAAKAVPEQERVYDVVWIGRVHRQKGIDNLLAALSFLRERIADFRAILIGNLRTGLEPGIQERGLDKAVAFSGFVSEEEKIRLFKASRLFLMPSKHEGSPRVIGESIICGTPVVAYEIPNYRPVFGDFVRYVPPFDREAFQRTAEEEILRMRSGTNYLSGMDLDSFRRENSWETTQSKFLAALTSMQGEDASG
jgi:glycosyltransferase involved in cell wall biosynthesis